MLFPRNPLVLIYDRPSDTVIFLAVTKDPLLYTDIETTARDAFDLITAAQK